jgi:hypothetical protein
MPGYYCIALVSLCSLLPGILGQQNYTYEDLQPCSLNTVEISKLGSEDSIEPCIIFDVQQDTPLNIFEEKSSRIAFVQVTPSNCGNHRDGAATGVQFLTQITTAKGSRLASIKITMSTFTSSVWLLEIQQVFPRKNTIADM